MITTSTKGFTHLAAVSISANFVTPSALTTVVMLELAEKVTTARCGKHCKTRRSQEAACGDTQHATKSDKNTLQALRAMLCHRTLQLSA